MYVQEIRKPQQFLDLVAKYGQPVRVGERALALPVREAHGVVVRAALERRYTLDVFDESSMGEVRYLYTEHLIEKDAVIDFQESLLNELRGPDAKAKILTVGHVSGSMR